MLLVVAFVVLVAAVLIPSFRPCCEEAPVASRLSTIGKALIIYANEHQDRFPPSLDTLVDERYLEPDEVTYPAEIDSSQNPSFVYIPGLTVLDSALNVVVYVPVGQYELHARPGGNVLFIDGSADWLEPDKHAAAIQRTRDYLSRGALRETPSDADQDEATDSP